MPFARMEPRSASQRASLLFVEECFAREDAAFLEGLRLVSSPKWLAAFADRWKNDARPWARAQLFAYLDQPLDSPGHQPLVKHLFKHAEAQRDDALMGAFLVAFDTLVRRVRRTRWRWDRATHSSWDEEYLATPRDSLPLDPLEIHVHPQTGVRTVIANSGQRLRAGRLFTHRTRHYLRRRAWRYFRWLGYGRPADYPAALAQALRRYTDDDLAKGENILDSWALLQACFHGCTEVIELHPRHHRLRDGHSLAELRAAPRFAAAWETPAAARELLGLVAHARSQLVRLWAMELLRRLRTERGLAPEATPDELLALLDHVDERVQAFGAELFEALPGLDKLPVATWLRLLGTRNLTALATLTAAFTRHVAAERLTLAQCLDLATASPVPVARLGFTLLQTRAPSLAPADSPALAALADARCPAVAGEMAAWALARLGARERYDVTLVSRFFDSLGEPTRDAAWAWLITPAGAENTSAATTARPVAYEDPVLWSRLAETPFDDLRFRLVDHLALRVATPALTVGALTPVWCSVLLGVHRGGRQKLKALRALTDALVCDPAQAPQLLPVLAVAVRSVRGPEQRAGLAAVMTLVAARPVLAAAVRARLPELAFVAPEETAA